MFPRIYLPVILILVFWSSGWVGMINAQGCCSGGTPLSGNLDLTVASGKSFSFRLIYDYNKLGDLVVGERELEDDTRTRLTHSALLRVGYSFNDWLSATALFSYVSQIEEINVGGTTNSRGGNGLGDLVILLQYTALNDLNNSIAFAGGFKAPTGPINRMDDELGLLLNPDLQPGTGSWDILAIASFTRKNFLVENLNFRSNITYRWTSEADRFNQLQRYKFGNETQVFFGLANSFFIRNMQLNPQLMFRYRHTLFDQTNGGETPNTGGHWGYIVPGIELFLNQQLGIGFLTEWPIYRQLEGIQLTTSYKLTVNLVYGFSLPQKRAPKKIF